MLPIMTTAILAAAVAATPAPTVKDGVDAWQQGAFDRAVAIWRPLAQQGDADAAFNLAQALKLGRGVPTDLAQAKIWYGKAAAAGHPQAIANYGLLLFQEAFGVNAHIRDVAGRFAAAGFVAIAPELFQALPYLMTVLVLVLVSSAGARRRLGAPASLGTPYVREER